MYEHIWTTLFQHFVTCEHTVNTYDDENEGVDM